MFISQFSGKQYSPGAKPVRVVVETRPKSYMNKSGEKWISSTGWEIVKELICGADEVERVQAR